jgi:hypothetical protein
MTINNKTHILSIKDIYREEFETIKFPKGYRPTGDFRPAKQNEIYLESGLVNVASYNHEPIYPRIILEKVDILPGLSEEETNSLRANLKYFGFDQFFEPVERRIVKKGDFYCTCMADWVKKADSPTVNYDICSNYVILKPKKNDGE